MWHILQTLRDRKTNKLVVYLGVKGNHMIGKNEDGRIIKDRTGKRFKEIRNERGKILIGDQVEKWETYGCYFGYLKPHLWEKVHPDMDLKKYVKGQQNE
ncbi:hypothetical protein J7J62_08990 [bacterium]|nr:hypothetical protein [bacterium]